MRKCEECNKTLNNFFTYCETCEKYCCMECLVEHRDHNIVFFRYENGEEIKINTGYSAAGMGKRHTKFFKDENMIFRHENCGHIENSLNKNQPIFDCEDKIIRCHECLYNSNLNLADPLIKIEKNNFRYLLTHSYEPQNLNFDLTCDEKGLKGKKIKLIVSIENNKKYPINDINMTIEAYAAKPLPDNESYEQYINGLSSRRLIHKKLHFESINPKIILKKELNIKIPKDYEIKKNLQSNIPENYEENEFEKNGFLKVPNNLMIYAEFTYKTFSGFEFYSEIKNCIIKLI